MASPKPGIRWSRSGQYTWTGYVDRLQTKIRIHEVRHGEFSIAMLGSHEKVKSHDHELVKRLAAETFLAHLQQLSAEIAGQIQTKERQHESTEDHQKAPAPDCQGESACEPPTDSAE